MFPRADPREAIGAQFRDLAQQKTDCEDQDSAEVLHLLWRIDVLLDRWLALVARDRPCEGGGPRENNLYRHHRLR